jgi:hypothetical protein
MMDHLEIMTTEQIHERLRILMLALEEEGSYVRSNTVWLAMRHVEARPIDFGDGLCPICGECVPAPTRLDAKVAARDAEIDRLRKLVEAAFREGAEVGHTYSIGETANDLWEASAVRGNMKTVSMLDDDDGQFLKFSNMVKSLYNIDADQLPELTYDETGGPYHQDYWPEFRDDPPRFFNRTDLRTKLAIYREVLKRQKLNESES